MSQTVSCNNQTNGTILTTTTEPDKRQQSKKMIFSLKLDKFSGACDADAKLWLLQFAQYCTCYDLDNKTRTNISSCHLQDHAKIWYNSLSDDIRQDWDKLKSSFIKRFTEESSICLFFK